MRITESVEVDADAARAWSIIGNPNEWRHFHHKIQEIECPKLRKSASVDALLLFRTRLIICEGHITDYIPHYYICIEFQGKEEGRDPVTFTVSFRIVKSMKAPKVKIIETVEYHVRINPLFKAIIYIINKIGFTAGEDHMQKLKKLIETQS